MPAIVVSNLAPAGVVHDGPYEHCSSLALIESTFGLTLLTAREANAKNLGHVLGEGRRERVPSGAIPRSSQVIGPVISTPSESLVQVLEGTASFDPAAVCSATSVQSVSPAPVGRHGKASDSSSTDPRYGTAGMADLARRYRRQ